jgi:hypothetical protein
MDGGSRFNEPHSAFDWQENVNLWLDHIAIVTTSLEKCTSQIRAVMHLREIQSFPAVGTREQYAVFGQNETPSFLFLEPIQPGPYQRALEKRGPGLHHLGCCTDSLTAAIDYFAQKGLLLHPQSLQTYSSQVVWMCRPGIPFLIELYVSRDVPVAGAGETMIALPEGCRERFAENGMIPGTRVVPSSGPHLCITVHGVVQSIFP